MSVTSEQSTITIDGTFLITGKLFVARIERNARLEPIEAYAGPAYGKPITHTDTREIALTFSDSRQLATSKDVCNSEALRLSDARTFHNCCKH
jgi:hypothetical protein